GGDSKKNAQSPPVHPSTSASSTAPTSTVPTSPATSTSPPATSSAPASTVAAPPPDSVKRITVPPLISGWHGVLSPKEKVAYDVPPGWKVETPGTLVGFEDNKGRPIAIMHGVSTYRSDACPTVPGSYRGHTGFATAGDLAPTAAARAGVSVFARGVALRDNGSRAPISRTQLAGIRVDRGKIEAEYARATVSLNDKSDCGSPSVVVVAVAFRTGPHATALFIGYFDQGVRDALQISTARKIFTTLRPYTR
ncbi:MAG: hypothetical protein INR67_02755, partial [Jatrophihabitans endophyticus]|nr:hypothetical protein [Jatrophihabitans endophyticus]